MVSKNSLRFLRSLAYREAENSFLRGLAAEKNHPTNIEDYWCEGRELSAPRSQPVANEVQGASRWSREERIAAPSSPSLFAVSTSPDSSSGFAERRNPTAGVGRSGEAQPRSIDQPQPPSSPSQSRPHGSRSRSGRQSSGVGFPIPVQRSDDSASRRHENNWSERREDTTGSEEGGGPNSDSKAWPGKWGGSWQQGSWQQGSWQQGSWGGRGGWNTGKSWYNNYGGGQREEWGERSRLPRQDQQQFAEDPQHQQHREDPQQRPQQEQVMNPALRLYLANRRAPAQNRETRELPAQQGPEEQAVRRNTQQAQRVRPQQVQSQQEPPMNPGLRAFLAQRGPQQLQQPQQVQQPAQSRPAPENPRVTEIRKRLVAGDYWAGNFRGKGGQSNLLRAIKVGGQSVLGGGDHHSWKAVD